MYDGYYKAIKLYYFGEVNGLQETRNTRTL
jgi:hypothetical protein